MKNKGLTVLTGAGLAFLLALGTCGCIITAFDLTIENFRGLGLLWAAGAAVCAAAFSWKRGGYLVLALGMLGGYWLWRQGELLPQFWQLVYRVTHIYNRAYHWGVFRLVDTPWNAGTADLPILVLGMVLAAAVAWTVCRKKSVIFAVDLTALPLLSCVVVTDTVPEEQYLYLLICGLVLLLFCSQAQKQEGLRGSRLVLMALVPVALAVGILFYGAPQENYVNRSGEIREEIFSWFRRDSLPGDPVLQLPSVQQQPGETEQVDLASLGSRRTSRETVFHVTAQTGGALYLRGQDYDRYDGTGWQASPNRVEEFPGQGKNLGYVVVETRRNLELLYLPYYPRDGLSLIGGAYENTRLAKTYSFIRTDLPENWQTLAAQGEAAEEILPVVPGNSREDRYLALPEQTRAEAAALLPEILAGQVYTGQKAQAIAGFVREQGIYDAGVQRMPEGKGDFALWFLKEGKTGYCVHFATAAVVLLRAAGIEARYVSGYMVPALPEERVSVTGEHAHAWAEYYEPGLKAWVVLEATPAEGIPATQPPPAVETQPTVSTTEATRPAVTAPETTAPPMVIETAPPLTVPPEQLKMEPENQETKFPLLAAGLGLLLLTELQRWLRLWLNQKIQNRGDANRRCLQKWRQAERMAKHLKEKPPEKLEALALKAKFSQHTLTEAELGSFDAYLKEARGTLRKRPWYWRLAYRYLFALY